MTAILKAWGVERPDDTPRLVRWLKNVFTVAVERRLTVPDLALLLDYTQHAVRAHLSRGSAVESDWAQLAAMKRPQDFDEQIQSTRNRLDVLYSARTTRRFLALDDPAVTLDFARAFDESAIILVNLQSSANLDPRNARAFGTLMLSELFDQARQRRYRPDGRPPKLFGVYVDECQLFLTPDFPALFAEGRKMGLAVTVANQFLEQLRHEDPRVLGAINGAARTRVCFAIGSGADAQELVQEVFPGQIDFTEVKHTHERVAFRPVAARDQSHTTMRGGSRGTSHAVGESYGRNSSRSHQTAHTQSSGETHGFAHSHGHTSAAGQSVGESHSSGLTSGVAQSMALGISTPDSPDAIATQSEIVTSSNSMSEMSSDTSSLVESYSEADGESDTESVAYSTSEGTSESEGYSEGESWAETEANAWSEGESWSESTTDAPVTRYEEYVEESEEFYSLEEQRQRLADRLRRLPQRHCVVRTADGKAREVEVPVVTDPPIPRSRVAAYEDELAHKNQALTAEAVDQLIEARRRSIEAQASAFFDGNAPTLVHSGDEYGSQSPTTLIDLTPRTTKSVSKPGRKAKSKVRLQGDQE